MRHLWNPAPKGDAAYGRPAWDFPPSAWLGRWPVGSPSMNASPLGIPDSFWLIAVVWPSGFALGPWVGFDQSKQAQKIASSGLKEKTQAFGNPRQKPVCESSTLRKTRRRFDGSRLPSNQYPTSAGLSGLGKRAHREDHPHVDSLRIAHRIQSKIIDANPPKNLVQWQLRTTPLTGELRGTFETPR